MNKLVKGSIAGAAGIALLLGGASTFALWNANATVAVGSIEAGTLALKSNTDGGWTKDITAWVPGDSDTYTETFVINAVGDNLQAELSADFALPVNTAGVTAVPTFVVTPIGTAPAATLSGGVYTLGNGSYDVTLSLAVNFAAGAVGDNSSQGATVTLGDVEVLLNQVTAP
ncbi:alternate-type signal peptide domain-containing protein [Diaminobutyricimonas sp. TR449]|uniref:alternate-type signal peptide domain-containing protein n=1 Tax=Diaminobutyricimonas sp. TR449 TaxID=2708076 RepID=UPI0014242462|nr:alternate-type signal peptide domain-containing protein [Diaminobutyricimonas sp. TR449]